jgi:virginiamycin B lyase
MTYRSNLRRAEVRKAVRRGRRFLVESLESRHLLSVTFKEFPVPTPDSGPIGITAGPDGNLWFTEGIGKIGRITPAGVITEFTVPTTGSGPDGITAGPDGNLWFTEDQANQIGRITTAGVITEFAIPTANSRPDSITTGPDGNLWFTETAPAANQIGRITTAGLVTGEFLIPSPGAEPRGITAGPDGALWFAESGNPDAIGRITTSGTFSPATPFSVGNGPISIVTGPDGNLWFTEAIAKNVGRITPSGTVTTFATSGFPTEITTGPDGNLWFTEGSQVAQITPTGALTEFSFPGDENDPRGITAGPNDTVWVAEHGANKIGEVLLSAPVTAPDLALSGTAPNSVTPGSNVTYTLTVTNNGTAGATGATLIDTLPAGVTFVSATGGVTPVGGVLTFNIGNLAAGASASFTIVVTPTATGSLTNTAAASMNQTDPTPADNSLTQLTAVTPVSADGPIVTLVQRFGIHLQPTTIVLTFDKLLDPATAQDLANYELVGLGRPRHAIGIAAAVYDATTRTVTISPLHRLNFHHRFRLTVIGTPPSGVRDLFGNLLDGEMTGHPGSNFETILTAANLAGPAPDPIGRRHDKHI